MLSGLTDLKMNGCSGEFSVGLPDDDDIVGPARQTFAEVGRSPFRRWFGGNGFFVFPHLRKTVQHKAAANLWGPLPTVINQFWTVLSKSLFDRLAICRANEKFAVINLLHKVGHFLLPNGNSVKFKGKPYVYLCLESNQCEFLYCFDMLLPLRLKVPLNC